MGDVGRLSLTNLVVGWEAAYWSIALDAVILPYKMNIGFP
jgi:hypothetical protein